MAFITTFVNRGRCVVQIGSGIVLGSERVGGTRAVREHVQSGAELTHGLVDLSDVAKDLAFGMARMWEAMVAGTNWRTRVSRDSQAARAWLRIDLSS